MNKYRQQSKDAQRQRKQQRRCGMKRRYESQEAAYQKGQDSYPCPHCGGWHRSGSMAALIAELKRPFFRQD